MPQSPIDVRFSGEHDFQIIAYGSNHTLLIMYCRRCGISFTTGVYEEAIWKPISFKFDKKSASQPNSCQASIS